ncbi:EAL and modified HD-GYP domain-containing signal transduction protein [Sporosarcina luteola]|nr:EAL and modified HD-GYP domain-containing signal transduction protein [Sporosarcina luteola]
MSQNIFVGRQPILDRHGRIYGYELLYRNSEKNRFPQIDPEKATVQLLVNTFLTIGVDKIAGNALSFINFTGDLLTKDIFTGLRPDRIVIEILEDVEITPALLTRIRDLKHKGFIFALDDFVLQEQYLVHESLFEMIDFVKVDFMHADAAERNRIEAFLKKYPHIWKLAEKLETVEQYNEALARGYDLFQGYFFAAPEVISGVDIPFNFDLHVQLLEKMSEDSVDINDIACLIRRDISLSFKLLRFINTMAFEVPMRIVSIKQAIVLIGLKETRKWLHILTLVELAEQSGGHIKALISYSLTRAKLCELLAGYKRQANTDECFLVGMFSLLDVIMNKSWDDIIQLMPLSEKTEMTLRREWTDLTPFLELAIAVERFDWERIELYAKFLGIPPETLGLFSQEANRWARLLD